jgi:hypothetical protein
MPMINIDSYNVISFSPFYTGSSQDGRAIFQKKQGFNTATLARGLGLQCPWIQPRGTFPFVDF